MGKFKGGNNGDMNPSGVGTGFFIPNQQNMQNIQRQYPMTRNPIGKNPSSSIKIESTGQGEDVFGKLFKGQQSKSSSKINYIAIISFFLVIIILIVIYYNRVKIMDFINNLFGIENTDDEYKTEEKKKEVFNVVDNSYTYEEANKVCDLINKSKLATYDQVLDAYDNGAEWCNYGWSDEGMALYPMQTTKTDCGSKGINGGYFDKQLKFGVNCYGEKPDKKNYNYDINTLASISSDNNSEELQEIIEEKEASLMGFNNNIWSEFDTI